jgi:hypothetical protein
VTRAARTRAWAAALALAACAFARGADLKMATDPMIASPAATTPGPLTAPPEHRRPPDQTFLTFPEWYLVHSPAEYARYLASGAPVSAFPLFAHIRQFWQGYAAVTHEVRRYPFNGGYHLMICVIGASTTVEYALKGLYEHTIGRLAQGTASGPVPEERFAAAYAQRYVDFIRVDPWYLFDFGTELRTLWSDVPASGPNLIRRWERRFLLTTELLVKSGYGHLIKWATHSIYDAPRPVTAVVLTAMPARAASAANPEFALLGSAPGGVLATLPRYAAFTPNARWLALQGIDFREIAGNDGEILVSVLVHRDWVPNADERVLFEQPVITEPGVRRSVLAVPIGRLGAVLRAFQAQRGLRLEHIYDF